MDDYTGRIGIVSGGHDPAAKLIKLVTRSEDHHTVIALDATYCVSAEPDMVRVMRNDHYPHIRWMPPQGSPEQMAQVAWHARQMVNTPYNRVAFVLAGLDTLRLLPAWSKPGLADWADNYGVTCSMMADQVHEAAGVDLRAGSPVYTTPAELAQLGNIQPVIGIGQAPAQGLASG